MAHKLGHTAGKRISEVFLRERTKGVGAQAFLVFSDGSYCLLRSADPEIDIIISEVNDLCIGSELNDDRIKTITDAICDKDKASEQRARVLFHSLWSNAGTGNGRYDKKEWMKLAQILIGAGIHV